MRFLKRLDRALLPLCGMLSALCLLAVPAFARSVAQTPQGAEKPRTRKVWTEDDLIALRTPRDVYVIAQERKADEERAAREAELAAKKAPDAARKKQGSQAGGPPPPAQGPVIPTRREDVQKRADELRQKVTDLESQVRVAQENEYDAREDQHAETLARLAALQDQLEKARGELRIMEDKLREFPEPPS